MTQEAPWHKKYEIGIGPWLAELQWILAEIFAAAPADSFTDAEYSVCEVYIDAPPHISATDRLSWYWRVKSKKIEVGTTELEDADVKVIVDYATIIPIGRLIFGDDEEARRTGDKLAEEAMRSGKMKLDYTQTEMPAPFNDLHDALAKITA